jgi:hypothetical protein
MVLHAALRVSSEQLLEVLRAHAFHASGNEKLFSQHC